MKKILSRLWKEEDGATAVEYGIMVAAIAAVIITTVIITGTETNDAFVTVNGELIKLP